MPRATLTRQAMALLALAAAPLMAGSVSLTADLDRRVLSAHNRERLALGIPALAWDDRLAESAKRWADHLGATGKFAHAEDQPGEEPQGENLWAGTKGHYSPESMVGLWVAEKKDFKPGLFPMNSRSGDVAAVGHYTQLAWRRTGAVGCALARSKVEDVLVCRYSTAGNVVGERPF